MVEIQFFFLKKKIECIGIDKSEIVIRKIKKKMFLLKIFFYLKISQKLILINYQIKIFRSTQDFLCIL